MGKKILLADDHSIIRYATRRLLEQHFGELSIHEVNNGEALLHQTLHAAWDLIITDIQMPGPDMFDIIAAIKKNNPGLPVLVFSLHREDLYAVRTLRAGGAGFLSKDGPTGEIIGAVNTVLSGKKYITAAVAEQLAFETGRNPATNPHEQLSDRELSVMKLLAGGKPLTEIASVLGLGITTISTYRSRILAKMKMKSNADLLQYAIAHQLMSFFGWFFADCAAIL